MYPEYTFDYIIFGILCAIALIITYKYNEAWKIDNKIKAEKNTVNLELENIKPISQEKVGNIVIKHFLILSVIFPIFWFIVLLKMNIPKESFLLAFSMVLFVELPIFIVILYNIGYDERLIKKHKINISENINMQNIKYFNIFRPTLNDTYPQYFIVDQEKNLIFRIKKSNFIGNKLVICDPNNIKIGEIKSKIFSMTDDYLVNIVNEKPFIIRSKFQLHSNYKIIGRDYYVKGDTRLIKNIIYDNQKNEIAYISAISKRKKNWYKLGNTEITLNENVNNSIDIIIIAACITIGNYQTFNRRIDRL